MTNLHVGKVPGVTTTKWERVWAERFPEHRLVVSDVSEAAQRDALILGERDMCFVRLPVDRDGLHAIPLYEEVPVVWLSKDHPLAELDQLTTEELLDDTVISDANADSIDLAAFGAAVLRVPMSVARSGSRRDLVYRPVIDADPTTIALAWRVDHDSELIDEFVGVVRGRSINSSRSVRERASTPPAEKQAAPKQQKQARRPKAGPDRRGRRR